MNVAILLLLLIMTFEISYDPYLKVWVVLLVSCTVWQMVT